MSKQLTSSTHNQEKGKEENHPNLRRLYLGNNYRLIQSKGRKHI